MNAAPALDGSRRTVRSALTWLRTLAFQAYMFTRRGYINRTSYRLNAALSVVNVLFGLISYFYLSRVVSGPRLGAFHANPAAFIITGTTFSTFVSTALGSYAGSLRTEMWQGTIEHWLLSESSMTRLVMLSTIWEFLWPLITTFLTFTVMALVLHLTFDIDVLSTVVFFLLTIVVMSGFGLISAGIIIISKVGDPLATAWGIVTSLLSGTLFPISVLPGWLQAVSNALPTYHALNGLRGALINHQPLWAPHEMHELVILLCFCAVTVPLGLLAFRLGFERARSQGTLAQF